MLGDGNWRISEAVNTSQSFHVIDGLKPGAVYTVRLMAKRLLDNASIFEEVIQTRVKGERREEPSQSIEFSDFTSDLQWQYRHIIDKMLLTVVNV